MTVIRVHRNQVTTGAEGIIGRTGVALADFDGGKGRVRVMGEIWSADTDERIAKGDPVRVTALSNMRLTVTRSTGE